MARYMTIFLLLVTILVANDDTFDSFEDEFQTAQEETKIDFDPLEGYNKAMTNFNDFTYTNVLDPTARGYNYIVGKDMRTFVANFFDNLLAPMRFANNLLQGKIENSGDELFRFALNSTLGFAGIADPAKILCNVDKHEEDFGQTLGYWGVGSGFPLVLPLLGPSNLRDTVGVVGDIFAHPLTYVKPQTASIGLKVYGKVNDLSLHLGEYEMAKKDAFDLYPFFQDLYEKRRKYLIEN